ncbi:cytochrome b561 [Wenxinia marina]|uniref:cytochrome c oxidase subunit II n=1 Tax=Wenxinia marina TaxID=390641 RepID=UPI000376E348|nr:cytochrome c oxidase subunit II [Wenxinia marina]GGL64660.1 cytochrome b561 [Wenxinia marina]
MKIRTVALAGALLALAACEGGPQSALAPAGTDAAQIARIFWVMLIAAAILWIALNGLFAFVTRIHPRPISRRIAETLIIGGGIVLPLILLGTLLTWGLRAMPDQRAPGDGLTVRVGGEQWWWRVEYLPADGGPPVRSANEVRLPAGLRTDIELSAALVIHSFWIPALGGKMDMIPGRVNRMSLAPTEPGTYRGQCAEFCGLSHALMALNAVVLPADEFDAWLSAEAAEADPPDGPGADLFAREGCGGCHAIRGTEWQAQVGPDLTHVGGRTSLAAGILPMTEEALAGWIRNPDAIKPGAEMPGYDHLSPEELTTLARWLMELT